MKIALSAVPASFVLDLFNMRTVVHMQHLGTQSHSQHLALEELYEGLTELTDKYAEVHMGIYGRYETPVQSTYDFPVVPVDTIARLRSLIDAEYARLSGMAPVQTQLLNILDELNALVSRVNTKLLYFR